MATSSWFIFPPSNSISKEAAKMLRKRGATWKHNGKPIRATRSDKGKKRKER